jgi:hypothetical protein
MAEPVAWAHPQPRRASAGELHRPAGACPLRSSRMLSDYYVASVPGDQAAAVPCDPPGDRETRKGDRLLGPGCVSERVDKREGVGENA